VYNLTNKNKNGERVKEFIILFITAVTALTLAILSKIIDTAFKLEDPPAPENNDMTFKLFFLTFFKSDNFHL
jgi:hypothetical protein